MPPVTAGKERKRMAAFPGYEELMAPHLDELRKYCYYLTRSKWDAEDLLQETLLKSLLFFLHEGMARPDLKPFMVRVARNLWIDDCRKKQRRSKAIERWQKEAKWEDCDYAEVLGAIEWLAERFPGRNINAWLLFHYFGYSMQDIAEQTNCTVSAVKSLLHRTREMLRNRSALTRRNKHIRYDVERWSRAVMHDCPKRLISDR
jgi:RNA polymerase sigma-70 factor (ECF subfamily)